MVADDTSDHTVRPGLEVRHYNPSTNVYIWVGAEARLVFTDSQIHSYHVRRTLSPVSLPVNTIYTYYLRDTRLLLTRDTEALRAVNLATQFCTALKRL